jgi:hypothetical protein
MTKALQKKPGVNTVFVRQIIAKISSWLQVKLTKKMDPVVLESYRNCIG